MSKINKRLKTPLRWAGGKSRFIYKLHDQMGDITDINEIRDPFLGGGSFPLYLSKLYPNKKVWVNDLYFPVYNFWIQLRDNCKELKSKLLGLLKEHFTIFSRRLLFFDMKKAMNDENESLVDRAVAFFVVNKCSFSGLTESGSFSGQSSIKNLNKSIINALSYYSKLIQHWRITNVDYAELLNDSNDVFIYLDPPYDIKSNLYGKKGDMHKNFNHETFKENVQKTKSKIMISYNKEIDGLNNNKYPLTYTLRTDKKYIDTQKKREEFIIKNY